MPATFTAYMDESGDEGFNFGNGTPDWFVISAAVTRTATDAESVRAIDRIKTALGKNPKKPLHFRRLKPSQKAVAVQEIAAVADVRVMSVMVHKPSLTNPETFQEPNILYFYTVRYLIERISWYCRDHLRKTDLGDGTAHLIFGKREGMPYPDMQAYVRRLRERTEDYSVQIHWGAIRAEQVEAAPMGRYKGLQIADVVAGSFFCAVDETRNVARDHSCAVALKPVVYHRYGKYLGYGKKFFPKEVQPRTLPLVQAW